MTEVNLAGGAQEITGLGLLAHRFTTYGAEYSTNLIDWFYVADTGTGGQHVFAVPMGDNEQVFLHILVKAP